MGTAQRITAKSGNAARMKLVPIMSISFIHVEMLREALFVLVALLLYLGSFIMNRNR